MGKIKNGEKATKKQQNSCIDAPRSLDHESHPAHPLTLLPTPTYSHRSFTCNACGLDGKAFSYCCAKCHVDLHVQCACMPKTILVKCHPDHALELMFGSPYQHDESVEFMCDVCDNIVHRDLWLYYCSVCDFGAHLGCTDHGNGQRVAGKDDDDYYHVKSSKASGIEEAGSKGLDDQDLQNETFEAQRKLRDQAIAQRLMLQALENAADYVGPSYRRRYYY